MNEQINQDTAWAEPSDARSSLRQSRELVTVGPQGVQITSLQQQIDYAQSMAKAEAALPKHLQGKVGDCLAVIDISMRAGLSPYMVANKTYVQNDRLCFESQLFHAFAQASGLLHGDLDVRYEGEGGERVCIIIGRLRADPTHLREHKSPPLKELHPGWVVKRQHEQGGSAKRTLTYLQGLELKANGELKEGEELFCKGSPLWGRKPDVQMFYDTSRDWVRIYCPRATLGIYTVDELEEYGPDFARDVTPATSGLADRLKESHIGKEEGHREGHAAEQIKGADGGKRKGKTSTKTKNAAPADEKPTAETAKDEPGRVDQAMPKTPQEYDAYCRKWLAGATDADAVLVRWRQEMRLRNDVGMTSDTRDPLEKTMKAKREELEGKR